MATIQLETSDGEVIDVGDKEIASCSRYIMKFVNIGTQHGYFKVTYSLQNVSSATVQKVIEWAAYHKNNDENKAAGDISSWDEEFLNVDPGTLFELTMAADQLEIQGLLDLTYNKVENMVKGKTPEEVRMTLGIPQNTLLGVVEGVMLLVNNKMKTN